jgi:hypothetical protein
MKGDCCAVDHGKIIEVIRKIIRSEGSNAERLKRIWEFLEAVEKEGVNDKK